MNSLLNVVQVVRLHCWSTEWIWGNGVESTQLRPYWWVEVGAQWKAVPPYNRLIQGIHCTAPNDSISF